MALLVGIAGGSGAGKTALLSILSQRLGRACIIDLDSYYRDRSHLSTEERSLVNYDEPSAFDRSLLLEHLRDLAGGKAIFKPRYSFETHSRVGVVPVTARPVVLVEGLLTLWWEDLRAVLDLKVFVDAPPDVRLLRRLMRDTRERGRTSDSVLTQYLTTVRPMHERYVEPTKVHADCIVNNGTSGHQALQDAAAAILRMLPDVTAAPSE